MYKQEEKGIRKIVSKLNKKKSNIMLTLSNHILNNKREYVIIIILFFIGLTVGVFFINNIDENQTQEITNYLKNFILSIKEYKEINLFQLFKQSLIKNIIIILLLWIGASTIIGIPIIYGVILAKGFSIGYTISSLIIAVGVLNGTLISIILLLLPNVIFIPAIFAISSSGIRLYKSVVKNKQKEDIKFELLRHTIFCGIMLFVIVLSSVIEVFLSTNIFKYIINYINI